MERRDGLPAVDVADFWVDLETDRELREEVFSFKLLELVLCERLSFPRFAVLCMVLRVLRVGFELAGEKILRGGTSGTGENS